MKKLILKVRKKFKKLELKSKPKKKRLNFVMGNKIKTKKKKIIYPFPERLKNELHWVELDEHRKFNCIYYDNCIDHASTHRWQSFTCKNCIHYFGEKEGENGLRRT